MACRSLPGTIDRWDIDVELRRRGIRRVDIAAPLGVTRGCVQNVMDGRRRNAEVERAIARRLELPVSRVRAALRATQERTSA